MTAHNRTLFIGAVTLIAILIFSATLVRALFWSPETELPGPPDTGGIILPVTPQQHPAQLEIPSLDIDTNVQHVGVKPNGDMAAPSNFTDVGWYKWGTAPGLKGSAVMDGHVDNGLGLDGVFKHLGDIKAGDDLYVTTKGGERLHFKVEEVVSYNYKDVPLEKLFNRDDRARLNLVTCEGNWIKDEKTYDKRLIVYSVLVND